MGDFRISLKAREWFSDLRTGSKPFRTDFDIFYFCFMAGISAGEKKSLQQSETAQLVDYFPDRYVSRGKLLIGLFLARELRELGVEMRQREAVNAAISSLIDPHAGNYLSDLGIKEFNSYAHGGYGVLIDRFDDRPRNLDMFLRTFKMHIDELAT